MKNFKAISMDCNEEQFESMKDELIELGCDVDVCDDMDSYSVLTNNCNGKELSIFNYDETIKSNHNREYIGAFDKEAFLKACGKDEEVNELPEKWCVKHTSEALDWIRKNAEKNGNSIQERNFYMMPRNEYGNNSSDYKPEGYTLISEQQFKNFVLSEENKNEKSGWYAYQDTQYLMYHNTEKGKKFGFSTTGEWRKEIDDSVIAYSFKEFVKIDNEQVLQRLTEEAKRRGLADLNNVELISANGNHWVKGTIRDCGNAYDLVDNTLDVDGVAIMKNGKWAEIIKNEEPKTDSCDVVEEVKNKGNSQKDYKELIYSFGVFYSNSSDDVEIGELLEISISDQVLYRGASDVWYENFSKLSPKEIKERLTKGE